jgi:hypothetical protein
MKAVLQYPTSDGNHRDKLGTKAIKKTAIEAAATNGKTRMMIRSTGSPPMPDATNRFSPKGGVIKPTDKVQITTIPTWVCSGRQGWAVFAKSVFDQNLAVSESEDIDHARFNAAAIGFGAAKRALGNATVAHDKVHAIEPCGVGEIGPSGFESLGHLLTPLEGSAQHVGAGHGMEFAIVVHETHQGGQVVSVPRSSEVGQGLGADGRGVVIGHGWGLHSKIGVNAVGTIGMGLAVLLELKRFAL